MGCITPHWVTLVTQRVDSPLTLHARARREKKVKLRHCVTSVTRYLCEIEKFSTSRKSFTIYKFAEFAEFQEVFPQNSPCKNSYAKFCEKTLLNSANSALQNNNTCGMDASL